MKGAVSDRNVENSANSKANELSFVDLYMQCVAKPATAKNGGKACSSIEGGLLITETFCVANPKKLLS